MASPIPLWLDCDPGHDDVFAILMAAYHPSIELLGISTVYGNAPLNHTTWNATSILTAISKEDQVKVYAGAVKPISRPPMTAGAEIHGATGLDGTDLLPQPAKGPVTTVGDDAAVDATVDAMAAALLAQPAGTAWLVATGCLTNVALLLQRHPAIAAHLAGLSIMGGAIGDGFTAAVSGEVDGVPRIGNTTMFAEFNILLDPEAAAAVFDNPVLAHKTTLVPLDLTHLVLATAEVQALLLHGPNGSGAAVDSAAATAAATGKTTLRTMLVQLLMFFADTYSKVFGIKEGPPLHDPIAVAAVLTGLPTEIPFYDYKDSDPSKTPERFEVKVVTEGTTPDALAGKGQTGRTVARLLEPGQPGVRIPRGLDIPMFWKVIEECTTRADEANAKNGR